MTGRGVRLRNNNYLPEAGLLVLLPPLQPTTDTTLRARTRATRTRFIEDSSKLWPQIEQQRGSSCGQADPDPDLLFYRVPKPAAFPLGSRPQPIPRLRVMLSSTGLAAPRSHPCPHRYKAGCVIPGFFSFPTIFSCHFDSWICSKAFTQPAELQALCL